MENNASLLIEHFKDLLKTPQDVEKINAYILQLAVQGRLLPQDEQDEPACKLLERIRAEKESLVKQGLIKKEKPLPPVSLKEVPFEIPKSWVWTRLGEIMEFNYGKSLPEKKRLEGFIPVYGSNGLVGYHSTPLVLNSCIIIGRKGSSGAVNLSNNACWVIDTAYYVSSLNNLDEIFVFYMLKSLRLDQLGKGIKPGLNRLEAYNIPIPLPPLPEQKRIVAKVEELFELTAALGKKLQKAQKTSGQLSRSAYVNLAEAADRQALNKNWAFLKANFDLLSTQKEQIGHLRQTVLQLAVQGRLLPQNEQDEPAQILLERIRAEKERLIKEGRIKKENPLPPVSQKEVPFDIPKSWVWTRLGEITIKLGAGSTPKGGKSVYKDSGIKFIRSQNVWNDGLKLDNVAFISKEINHKMINSVVRPKDILLNITGASIGRSSLVFDDFDIGNVNQHVAIIRLLDPEIRYFTHLYMISSYVFNLIMQVQVGVSREGLSMMKLKNFPIPLPPLPEQKRIVAKVEELLALCNRLETKLEQSEQTRRHLLETLLRQN